MFNGITDLPELNNYDAAFRHWDSIVPIRGSNPPLRPICDTKNGRRKKHMFIHHDVDITRGKYVECVLYDTPVLKFWQSGETDFRYDGWNTQSTVGFINSIISSPPYPYHGSSGFVHKQAGEMYLCLPDSPSAEKVNKEGHAYYIIPNDDVLTVKNQGRGAEVLNPVRVTRLRVHKANAKKLRAMAQPFRDYCTRMAKLVAYSVEDMPITELSVEDTYNANGAAEHPYLLDARQIQKYMQNEMHVLAPHIYRQAIRRVYSYTTQGWRETIEHGDIVKAVTEFVKYTQPSYFERVEIPIGIVASDPYGKYEKHHERNNFWTNNYKA